MTLSMSSEDHPSRRACLRHAPQQEEGVTVLANEVEVNSAGGSEKVVHLVLLGHSLPLGSSLRLMTQY